MSSARIKYARVTAAQLTNSCPHGLIKQYPLQREESKRYWKKNNCDIDKIITTKRWSPLQQLTVICQHSDCINTQTWSDRVNARSFKESHWKNKHTQCVAINMKVVSFWSTQNVTTGTILETEYRLVNVNSLAYINPSNDMHINISDPVTSTNNDTDDNNTNNRNISHDIFDSNNNHNNTDNNTDTNINNNTDSNSVEIVQLNKRNIGNAVPSYIDSQPLSKRRRINTNEITDDDVAVFDSDLPAMPSVSTANNYSNISNSIPNTSVSDLSNILLQLQQSVSELKIISEDLKQTKDELKSLKSEFNQFKQKQHPKVQHKIANHMNMSKKDISSTTLREYVSKEGKTIWRLEQSTEQREKHILTCKLCEACKNVLIYMDPDSDEENESEEKQSETEPKWESYWKGQSIPTADIDSASFFSKKWCHMKKHCRTNSIHKSAVKLMNKELDLCANDIMVKSEVANQLFSRAEPDALFKKLLIMLFRISQIDECNVSIGDYGHDMARAWREVYMTYMIANLRFVLRQPNSTNKIRFYSISLDGWSKGKFMVA
eukprot:106268_1